MEISAVIITKNEGENIERCLKSLDFCDEIVIIDDYSTDDTISKVKNFRLKLIKEKKIVNERFKIIKRNLNDNFSDQKNFGFYQTDNDWVLFIDADEEISPDLKKEIKELFRIKNKKILEKEKIVAFYIKRRDFWWGRELRYGEVKKNRTQGLIRLVKKGFGNWVGKVHEKFEIINSEFKTKTLKNYINHYPHPNLKKFLEEINYYSSLRAKELYSFGKKTNLLEIIFFPLGKFFLNYFFYLGFLDSVAGFVYAFLMSFHSFLVRAKLYQFRKQNIKL